MSARTETVRLVPRPLRIELNLDEHGIFASFMGWDNITKEAEALGLEVSTVFRILSGQSAPGPRFIAHLLKVLGPHGVTFERLFQLVETDSAAADDTASEHHVDTTLQRSA